MGGVNPPDVGEIPTSLTIYNQLLGSSLMAYLGLDHPRSKCSGGESDGGSSPSQPNKSLRRNTC